MWARSQIAAFNIPISSIRFPDGNSHVIPFMVLGPLGVPGSDYLAIGADNTAGIAAIGFQAVSQTQGSAPGLPVVAAESGKYPELTGDSTAVGQ